MANLYDTLQALMEKAQRDDAANLYQPGSVVARNADGTYTVSVDGRVMLANPETDLPLTPGQQVYVSEVRNGRPLVHGPR